MFRQETRGFFKNAATNYDSQSFADALAAFGQSRLPESDPVGFLESITPITIDEVQLVPHLLREIMGNVNRDRTPGISLITGSADLDYAPDLSHALSGRVGLIERYHGADYRGGRPLWVSCIGDGHKGLSPLDAETGGLGGAISHSVVV